jgi:uncharacterized membrane protein
MSATAEKLVERYLKHLEVELDDLPRARRREIVDEISRHIAEARADLEAETEADVRNILETLGDPAEIAAEARDRFEVRPVPPAQAERAGATEIAALILLLVGGLVLPIFGWLIGVVLLWLSNAWNVRDKIIGTLFVPGGLGVPIAVLFLAGSGGGGSCGPITQVTRDGTTVKTQHATRCVEDGGTTSYLAVAGVIVLLVTPIITTAYLAYRLRRHPAAATA